MQTIDPTIVVTGVDVSKARLRNELEKIKTNFDEVALQLAAGVGGVGGFLVTNDAPSNDLGSDGNSAFDKTNGILYQKAAGNWEVIWVFPEEGVSDASVTAAIEAAVTGLATVNYVNQTVGSGGILYGPLDPDEGIGNDGNYYINTTSRDFFQRIAGAWEFIFSTAGVPGSAGTPFSIGASGLAATRPTYDDELAGFGFYATDTKEVSTKLSDTSADWGPWVPFTGDQGAAGEAGSFRVDVVGLLADRDDFIGEAPGFTYFAEDTGYLYVLKTTGTTWVGPIPFQGPNGEAAPIKLNDQSADYVLTQADLDERKVIRFDTVLPRKVFVPAGLVSPIEEWTSFSVINMQAGEVSVEPDLTGGSSAFPVIYDWAYHEQTSGFINSVNIDVPSGLDNRYIVVLAFTGKSNSDANPVTATATVNGDPATLIEQSPAYVLQPYLRAFAFGFPTPDVGNAQPVVVTFAGPAAISASTVVVLLCENVNPLTPYVGDNSMERQAFVSSALNLAISGVVPAGALIVGIGGMGGGTVTSIDAEGNYLVEGNCGSSAVLSFRWMVSIEQNAIEGSGKDVNFAFSTNQRHCAVGLALVPAVTGAAEILPSLNEEAKTAGARARLVCLYENYDGGDKTRVITEGGKAIS